MSFSEYASRIGTATKQACKKVALALIDASIFLMLLPCNLLLNASFLVARIPGIGQPIAFLPGLAAVLGKIFVKQLNFTLRYWIVGDHPMFPWLDVMWQVHKEHGKGMSWYNWLLAVLTSPFTDLMVWTSPIGWKVNIEKAQLLSWEKLTSKSHENSSTSSSNPVQDWYSYVKECLYIAQKDEEQLVPVPKMPSLLTMAYNTIDGALGGAPEKKTAPQAHVNAEKTIPPENQEARSVEPSAPVKPGHHASVKHEHPTPKDSQQSSWLAGFSLTGG